MKKVVEWESWIQQAVLQLLINVNGREERSQSKTSPVFNNRIPYHKLIFLSFFLLFFSFLSPRFPPHFQASIHGPFTTLPPKPELESVTVVFGNRNHKPGLPESDRLTRGIKFSEAKDHSLVWIRRRGRC